ncbi:MAG: DUF6259 domain-containing protein [Opitutaceae bacterium]|jgi:hypothetical protein|nr:DUF6259 domain-containing protein [Opitutaceae bacterium]
MLPKTRRLLPLLLAAALHAGPFRVGENLVFSINTDASAARFSIPGSPMSQPQNPSFWRLILNDDRLSEIPVFSNAQSGRAEFRDGSLLIHYDFLTAQNGAAYDIALDIVIRPQNGLLSFHPTLANNDSRVRALELQCPVIEASNLCGPRRDDILYMPHATGRRLPNPWDALRAHSTDYLANDESEISWIVPYPRGSMAWMGVETGGRFLYLGRHDDKIRNCLLIARRDAQHVKKPNLALAIAHMPAARPGEKIALPPACAGLLPGDWRSGASTYRAWASAAFFKPVKINNWVREMNGWQRLILRSQYGRDYYTADDLPRLFETGNKHGINALFLFGWWNSGMDAGYPEYDISGEPYIKLKENIKKVQDAGGHVILVCNANMIDPQTEFYKKHGANIIRHDINGNPYVSSFVYSDYSALRRLFAARQFHAVCYSSELWREQLMKQGRLMREFSPHCLFYDIFGSEPHQPCFNDKHPHGPRVDEDWSARRALYTQLANLCGPNVLATEITVDIAAAHVQFIHTNDGFSGRESPAFFPQMFRQTFPEVILSNRGVRDESPGFDKKLKRAFLLGLIFDVEIFRCRGNLSDVPEYAKLVGELSKKRQQYKDFLINGKYSLTDNNRQAPNIYCAEYESADASRRLRILYNAGSEPFTSQKYGLTLRPDELRFDETLVPPQ